MVRTPVTTAACPDCDAPKTWPGKWANFTDGDPDMVTFGLVSAVTQGANETVVFTDLLGAGQRLNCTSLLVQEADTIDAWGDIQFTDTWTPDSVTCDETAGTLTVTVTSARAGQYFRVLGTAIATETRTSYTDEGTITQRGVTQPAQASAIVYSGSAGGDGETPSPTPTPSEITATATPTPTETTPSETSTPTPTETTPSETPTPSETTPASNPTPSETTTTSTPSMTTTTKPPPRPRRHCSRPASTPAPWARGSVCCWS